MVTFRFFVLSAQRSAPFILLLLLLSGCAAAVQNRAVTAPAPVPTGHPSHGPSGEYTGIIQYAEGRLRGTVSATNLREPDAQPMTEGLLLSARSIEAALHGCKGTPELERAALSLLDGSDADGDGLIGWGLPQEADPFGDKTPNPPGHEYTITTSVAVLGLLDYRPLASPAVRKRIDDTIAAVAKTWTTRLWDAEGSFYWYSPLEVDRIATINVTSMMAGTLARAAASLQLPASTEAAIRTQAEAALAFLTRTATSGVPFWRYGVAEKDKTQDLIHHIYAVHGIELLRAAGYRVPWTPEQFLESLAGFWDRDQLMEYPVVHRPPGPLGLRPARLWGAGAAIAVAAAHGDTATAERLRKWIASGIYGEGPAYDLWPNTDRRHRTQAPSPRHLAHVAWGMAAHDAGWGYGATCAGAP